MTLDFSPITLIILCTPALLFFMLLPTLLEIKKPKDAGPRLIMPEALELPQTLPTQAFAIIDLEECQELDFLIRPLVSDILDALPSLES